MRYSPVPSLMLVHMLTAAAALAAACESGVPAGTRYSQPGVDATCSRYVDTLPTAIPTEQWTPEWLSEFSRQHQQAYRKYERQNIDRFVDARGSGAHLRRVDSMIDGFGTTLDDALRQADQVVSGAVTDQWLTYGRTDNTYELVSRIRDADGITADVRQWSAPGCRDGQISLAISAVTPYLEQGQSYAILVRREGDDLLDIGAYAYPLSTDGGLTPPPMASPADTHPATLEDLRSKLEAAHGRQG